jgi:hypothetical protein
MHCNANGCYLTLCRVHDRRFGDAVELLFSLARPIEVASADRARR